MKSKKSKSRSLKVLLSQEVCNIKELMKYLEPEQLAELKRCLNALGGMNVVQVVIERSLEVRY